MKRKPDKLDCVPVIRFATAVRVLPVILVLAVLGCVPASYMTVREFADRIDGRTSEDPSDLRVTVTSSTHRVVLTPGTGMVLINDRPHLLGNPVRYENGVITVPESLVGLVDQAQAMALGGLRAGCIVVIDAGHGGHDGGASYSGLDEKVVNLVVARYVARDLERRGYAVEMTRESDVFIVLEERTVLAQQANADILVSIHANAASDPSAHGVEVFYPRGVGPRSLASKRLADAIYRELYSGSGDLGRGVKAAGFEVLRSSHCAAALVEVGFLSHPSSRTLLGLDSYRRQLALSIARGIDHYATGEKQ